MSTATPIAPSPSALAALAALDPSTVYTASNTLIAPDTSTVYQDDPYTPGSVLVTGGAGFIGSHFCEQLLKAYPQCHLVIYDKKEHPCCKPEYVEKLVRRKNVTLKYGDILSLDFLVALMDDHQVDTVVHFAAETHVDKSFGMIREFWKTNAFGTLTVAEAAERCGTVQRFVHISTDEVYGNSGDQAREEHMPLDPQNPYSNSKVGAEQCLRSHTVPHIIIRPNNIIGPRQYPDKLVPKWTALLLKGSKLPIHGTGQQRRHFLYVTDAAAGILHALKYGQVGQVYNLGSHEEFTVEEVARLMITEHYDPPDSDTVTGNGAVQCGSTSNSRHSSSSSTTADGSLSEDRVCASGLSTAAVTQVASESPSTSPVHEIKHVVGRETTDPEWWRQYVEHVEDRKFQDTRYLISTAKLEALGPHGWRPRVSIRKEGLRRTMMWYADQKNLKLYPLEGRPEILNAHPPKL